MKDYLEEQMNGFNIVKDWRDEDGCGYSAEGRARTRISNVNETEYVIFVLERLIQMDHQLQIIKTKVNLIHMKKCN